MRHLAMLAAAAAFLAVATPGSATPAQTTATAPVTAGSQDAVQKTNYYGYRHHRWWRHHHHRRWWGYWGPRRYHRHHYWRYRHW
jgi:hypothetical protein